MTDRLKVKHCFLIIIISNYISCIKTSEISIKKLELYDVKDSVYEIDGMPLFFNLNIHLSNISFYILFKRNYDMSYDKEDRIKSYNSYKISIKNDNVNTSISDYEANCLMRRLARHSHRQVGSNLIDYYELNVDLFEKTEYHTYFQYEMISIKRFYSNNYLAFKNVYKIEEKLPSKKKIKREISKKYNLNVKICIHIDYGIYLDTINNLNTSNDDYVTMYLRMKFALIIQSVNKIYESFDNDLFELKTELIEFIIHNNRINGLNLIGSNELLDSVNIFIKDYYSNSSPCGHVFFIHNFKFKNFLGVAYVGKVCDIHYHTSHVKYTPNADRTMAHELAHNLGSKHDDAKQRELDCTFHDENLMSPVSSISSHSFLASSCTILEIQKILFDDNQNLKQDFYCLLNNKKSKPNIYDRISIKKLPGYYMSLSDQCRLLTNDTKSYCCTIYEDDCKDLRCTIKNPETNRYECVRIGYLIDGTSCGKYKFCYHTDCLDMNQIYDQKNNLIKKNDIVNLNDIHSYRLRQECPNGVSQEKLFFENPISYFVYSKRHKSCQDVLLNVCCEICLKYDYLKATIDQIKSKQYDRVKCESLSRNPCFNGGKCINNSSDSVGFDCICKRGFKGPLCLDYAPCSLNPCQENEICFEYGELAHYSCLCPADHKEYPYCRTELNRFNRSIENFFKSSSNSRRKIIIYLNFFIYILLIILGFIAIYKIKMKS